jgi:hypothetical protein
MEKKMKKLLASATAGILVLTATTAFAGGPVIVEDEVEVVAERPASSIGVLPLLLVPILLCAALCGGGGDDGDRRDPPK